MQRNEDQEKKCYDLLRRISALQIQEVHTYSQGQVNEFSSQNKAPVPNIAEELDYTRFILGGVLHDVPVVGDEETESSSEEESCDELNFGTRKVENYLQVNEAPGAKWARDRGAIITAWTWLQDAIGYVKFQRKQHEELYKHFRQSKVQLTVDDKFSNPARASAAGSSLVDAQIQIYKDGSESDQNTVSSKSMSPNMKRPSSSPSRSVSVDNLLPRISQQNLQSASDQTRMSGPNESISPTTADQSRGAIGGGLEALHLKFDQKDDDSNTVARRCLPMKYLRPRKIYRIQRLTAADSDDEICTCEGVQICSNCYPNGDIRRMAPSMKEAAASLDSSYHKNLCLPDNIPLQQLLSASLVLEGWKHNTPKSSTFRRIGPQFENGQQKAKGLMRPPGVTSPGRRGRPRLPKKADEGIPGDDKSAQALTPKEKATLGMKSTRRASSGDFTRSNKALIKRRKYNSVSTTNKRKRQSLEDDAEDRYLEVVKPPLTRPGPGRPRLSTPIRRKRDQTDINNIVIPYSIAAATRIEKIEYKEIITPNWRPVNWYTDLLQGKNGKDCRNANEDPDEAYVAMHARCEIDEQKRFLAAMKAPSSRRSRRTDSKTETVEPSISAPESPSMPASPHVPSSQIVSAVAATMAVTAVKVNPSPGRKRRVSRKEIESEENDSEDYGYEIRTYPIPDHEYKNMCRQMPDEFFDPPPKKENGKVTNEGFSIKATNSEERHRPTRHKRSK